jgi:hypothetical protein
MAGIGANDAARADSGLRCRLIDDIVRDIETGASPWLLDARFTLIASATDRWRRTVRRYSMHVPRLDASEVMQVEIIDPHDKTWDTKLAVRRLRVRPYSVSHWIDVMPSAVALQSYDVDAPCLQAKGESCSGFEIQFESKDGGLAVGIIYPFVESKLPHVDHVTLLLGERLCSDPERFDK